METPKIKNGMLARMESGSMAIILLDAAGKEQSIFSLDGECWTGDLFFKGINEWDESHNIVALYDMEEYAREDYRDILMGETGYIVPIWEYAAKKKKKKNMTISEIEKELGYKIKIVNEKGE